MKQTLDNIAYEIMELIRPNMVDDSSIDIRLIRERIGDLRSTYLKNEFNKTRNSSEAYVQDLGCLKLETVDPAECEGIETGNFIRRTIDEVPTPISTHTGLLFTRIGPVDKTQIPFNFYDYNRSPYIAEGRFIKGLVHAYYRDNRIYIYTKECVDFIKMIDEINVRGIFDDPEEIEENFKNNPCYSSDGRYPITRWLKEYIVKTIVQEMLQKISQPQDNINDGTNQ